MYQPLNANLTALSDLTTEADRVAYWTGLAAAALTGLTGAGRALIDDADAAAQRVTLGLSTIAASLWWAEPAAATIVLSAKAAFAFTIASVRGIATSAGTLTAAVAINGTPVTGLSAIAVTDTAQDVPATAANAVAVGDRVTLTVSDVAGAADLECTISATR